MEKIWQSTSSACIIGTLVVIAMFFCTVQASAQQFKLDYNTDSTAVLRLVNDSGSCTSTWQLPYPVYRFATADINGDGSTDAVVGVIKASRYFPVPNRRVFIFKNFEGDVRPLWLGSRLGGELIDFAIINDKIRAIEKTDTGYAVSDYIWQGFGMGFETLIATCNTLDDSYTFLPSTSP